MSVRFVYKQRFNQERGDIFTSVCSLKTGIRMLHTALMSTSFFQRVLENLGEKAISMIIELKKMPGRKRCRKLNLFSLSKKRIKR